MCKSKLYTGNRTTSQNSQNMLKNKKDYITHTTELHFSVAMIVFHFSMITTKGEYQDSYG